mmetsp:Transcript_36670/g.58663  ORF Transcript_36670/g.58663 Transcript_36670/m.58663 type:complete len:269 (+) Transcript_36670:160-966(+)
MHLSAETAFESTPQSRRHRDFWIDNHQHLVGAMQGFGEWTIAHISRQLCLDICVLVNRESANEHSLSGVQCSLQRFHKFAERLCPRMRNESRDFDGPPSFLSVAHRRPTVFSEQARLHVALHEQMHVTHEILDCLRIFPLRVWHILVSQNIDTKMRKSAWTFSAHMLEPFAIQRVSFAILVHIVHNTITEFNQILHEDTPISRVVIVNLLDWSIPSLLVCQLRILSLYHVINLDFQIYDLHIFIFDCSFQPLRLLCMVHFQLLYKFCC